MIVESGVGFNARLAWCWLVHHFCILCADCEAEVVAGIGDSVNAMLHISLLGSVEGAIICEQKVVHGVGLNLGLRLQSPEVEDEVVKMPSEADSDVDAFKRASQHGGEHQTEEFRGENTALLDSIGRESNIKTSNDIILCL